MEMRVIPWVTTLIVAVALLAATGPVAGKSDPANVVGPRAEKTEGGCAHCHVQEVGAWELSTHHKSPDKFETKEGKEIFAKLVAAGKAGGASSPQQADLCIQCHTTPTAQGSTLSVSCESCHGAAREWVNRHCTVKEFGDLHDKEDVRKAETAEQKAARFQECEAKGMIRPANLYRLASNCLGCHVVAHPELADAGHPAHSDTFELLSWSQGEIRHNFLRKEANAEPTPERRRLLYAVGQLADIEIGLRGLAVAAKEGPFFDAMKARVWNARKSLKRIKDLAPDPRWKTIMDLVGKKRGIVPAMGAGVGTRADQVKGIAEKLVADIAGGTLSLAAIDHLLPTSAKGKVYKPN